MKNRIKFYMIGIVCVFTIAILTIPTYASQYREQTDINSIDENRFPGIRARLLEIKSQHPNWNFTFLYTGLNWNTVIENETTVKHGRSLIQNKFGEWLCGSCGLTVLDGTDWRCASAKAVSYYMDVRNFLNEADIFQFETLSYVDGLYTETGVEAILSGSFMYNTSIRQYYNNINYTEAKFSTVIIEAGREAGVSPYHLASRIKQEIIKSGGVPSNSVTGTFAGYEGYYNFFNIGASSGAGAVERGLIHARDNGWNTPEISIKEGAKAIGVNYIAKGQNTLYLEKFDVDNSDGRMYSHQYQQNIQAPVNEGRRIHNNVYSSPDIINNNFNFVIPLYENMPWNVSPLPSDGPLTGEIMRVIAKGSLKLREQPSTSANEITYLITGTLVQRLEANVANANGYIWDKVKTGDGRVGYVASKYLEKVETNVEPEVAQINIDENFKNVVCTPSTTVQNLKDSNPNKSIIIKKTDGTELTDPNEKIGTGMEVIIDGVSYKVVKLGDTSGDGGITPLDYVKIKNNIMQTTTLKECYKLAGDVNQDGSITPLDYVKVKNHIMGAKRISFN